MKLTPRLYQIDARTAILTGFKKEKHPFIIQAATGAGKSLIIADVCHELPTDAHVLILQPSKEILEQNYLKLKGYDDTLDVGIYSASAGAKDISQYTFATIGSIYKIPEQFKHFEYVIIDECHGVNPKESNTMLLKFLTAIKCTKIVGLTATPYRIGMQYHYTPYGLEASAALKMVTRISKKPFFKKIVFKIETNELIDAGYLSPVSYFNDPVELDELVVNSTGADFTKESMEKFWNQKRLSRICAAVSYSDKHNKRTLVFCSSLKQAETAMKMAKAMGITAAMVSGTTPMKQREALIEDFRTGKLRHMFNVGVFTTGFDCPELDCIVLARPTMSLALYYQMVGRGIRLDPGAPNKVLQVYDLVGVVKRLGRVETIRVTKERGGFRDEVWSESGRMDNRELYNFLIPPKGKS